jgi:hypothetical protein
VEAKLPENPKEKEMIRIEQNKFPMSNADCIGVVIYTMYDKAQKDMLQFFIDFLDEHIELNRENRWDTMQLDAIKINFKNRFMGENNG